MQTPVVLGVYLTHLHLFLLNPGLSKNEIGGSRHVTRLPAPSAACLIPADPAKMVGPDGLEPSTPRLSSACSNQLSYEPENWQTPE